MNFTPAQLAWARSHDWFISGDRTEIKCREVYAHEPARVITFTNFKKLRDWAGY